MNSRFRLLNPLFSLNNSIDLRSSKRGFESFLSSPTYGIIPCWMATPELLEPAAGPSFFGEHGIRPPP